MWKLEDVEVGDLIQVEIVSGGHLHGGILTGVVEELVPSHNFARLHTGWCAHTSDKLVFHRKPVKAD